MDLNKSLWVACTQGDLQLLQHITSLSNVYLFDRNERGESPFWVTCHYGHLDLAKHLYYSTFVNIKLSNHDNITPLQEACRKGHVSIVTWLYPILDDSPCLHHALYGNHLPIVQWLLEHHHEQTPFDYEMNTPLHIACKMNFCVELLCKYNPSLDAANVDGYTPFLIACQFGHSYLCEYLYTQGASIHNRSAFHETSLLLACEYGNLYLVQWLHSHGVDMNQPDIYGQLPISIAASLGHTHLLPWLSHYSSIHHQTNLGQTPFLLACRNGHLSTAQMLQQLSTEPLHEHRDFLQCSPLYYAIETQHLPLVYWLSSFGISYDETLFDHVTESMLEHLFLLGACHHKNKLCTTPFMKYYIHTDLWRHLRQRLYRQYTQRVLLLKKNMYEFDDLMRILPWCSDVSHLISDFVGILRDDPWERLLTVK
jgi:ankyrin repeat protein